MDKKNGWGLRKTKVSSYLFLRGNSNRLSMLSGLFSGVDSMLGGWRLDMAPLPGCLTVESMKVWKVGIPEPKRMFFPGGKTIASREGGHIKGWRPVFLFFRDRINLPKGVSFLEELRCFMQDVHDMTEVPMSWGLVSGNHTVNGSEIRLTS